MIGLLETLLYLIVGHKGTSKLLHRLGRKRDTVLTFIIMPHSQCQGRLGHVTVATPLILCLHPSAAVGMTELYLLTVDAFFSHD